MVRIIKTELEYFKNVQYGEIKYMNYGCVEKNASIEKNDIVGISKRVLPMVLAHHNRCL